MSVFITCDGTVSVSSDAVPSCDGTWNSVESADVFQNSGFTAAEWEYVWDGIIWIFVAAAAWIVLMRLTKTMSTGESTHDS